MNTKHFDVLKQECDQDVGILFQVCFYVKEQVIAQLNEEQFTQMC